MKAVVFAAGIGSRLKPFTDFHPKALVPLNGSPILSLVLQKLVAAGVDGIVVNVHHYAQQIVDYLQHNYFGIPVEISDETTLLLDTAGGLAKMARESKLLADVDANESIIIHNADILTDFKLDEMTTYHLSTDADATILVDRNRKSSRAFIFNEQGRLVGWHNSTSGDTKPATLSRVYNTNACYTYYSAPFGGVHVVRRNLIDIISQEAGVNIFPSSITDFYIDHVQQLKIRAYMPALPYHWHDIGTPEKLNEARRDLFNQQQPS